MANSSFLRKNLNQHVVKNIRSKTMDSEIEIALSKVIHILIESDLYLNEDKKFVLSCAIIGRR